MIMILMASLKIKIHISFQISLSLINNIFNLLIKNYSKEFCLVGFFTSFLGKNAKHTLTLYMIMILMASLKDRVRAPNFYTKKKIVKPLWYENDNDPNGIP
jgi:hypothetical protein